MAFVHAYCSGINYGSGRVHISLQKPLHIFDLALDARLGEASTAAFLATKSAQTSIFDGQHTQFFPHLSPPAKLKLHTLFIVYV